MPTNTHIAEYERTVYLIEELYYGLFKRMRTFLFKVCKLRER